MPNAPLPVVDPCAQEQLSRYRQTSEETVLRDSSYRFLEMASLYASEVECESGYFTLPYDSCSNKPSEIVMFLIKALKIISFWMLRKMELCDACRSSDILYGREIKKSKMVEDVTRIENREMHIDS
jgi:hypothetical protein